MKCPYNNVVVQLEKKFQDEIVFASGVKLYQDTSFHPEEHTTLSGTVVSVPDKLLKRQDYEGYQLRMQPGDEIMFRYDVIFAYKDQPDRDTPVYKNLIYHDFKEYWLCDIQKIFAIKTKDGYNMQNGYVMVTPFIEEKDDHYAGLIWRPESEKTVKRKDRGYVKYIGEPLSHLPKLSVQPGDLIAFDGRYTQEYKINEDIFYIIKQSHILGRVSVK